ncbi:MAG: SurA N-terminal domain-containing protein [Pseudomonadales bacterium]
MMLQKMREQTQGLGFKLIVGLLILVLAVFGFGGFNLFANNDPQVASVNGTDISQAQLINETQREQQRMAAQFGPDFDPNLIDPAALQGQVLNRLISQELLVQKADELGLGASPTAVGASIRNNPNFQIAGKFDEETYRRTVRLLGFSPQGFMAETERALQLEQFSNAVTESSLLTDWELRNAAKFLNQQRDLAHLDFAQASFAENVTVSDADVTTFYEENTSQYMTPETANAAYVSLSWRDLLDDDSIAVEEADIVSVFEADLEAAEGGAELRDSSHILLRVTEERDEAATLALMNSLAAEVKDGADFNELAKERSEDPGSKLQGGSLGPIGKGVFDPEFEKGLWALQEPGEVSEPIKSAFGYHLIRLDSIDTRPPPTLAERRGEIESQLREQQARALFDSQVRELDNLAFENPDSLEAVAENLGLQVRSVEGITVSAGEGVFAEQELREALFSAEVLDTNQNSAAIRLADDQAVVVRVAQLFPSEPQPEAEVSASIRADITAQRATELLNAAFEDALTRVSAGEAVSAVAADHNLQWQRHEAVSQSGAGAVPAAVLGAAFKLPAPQEAQKSVGRAELPEGGLAIVTVTRVQVGDWTTMSDAERDNLRRYLADRASRLDFVALYMELEEQANINRPIASTGS